MITVYYKIRCDSDYCFNSFEGHTLKRAAMAEARALGWSFRLSIWGYSHICPKCIAAAKEPPPVSQGTYSGRQRPPVTGEVSGDAG